MATKAERDHMGAVAAMGCIVCRNLGFGASPAEVHHIGHVVAVHAGRKAFEANFGTERELLEQTRRELDV